jgi:hypothetical protein
MVQGSPTPDPNATRNAAKRARLQAIAKEKQMPRVRVVPADDTMRRILKHPRGMAFRSSGSVEWPFDKFTQRRLADGSVLLEDKKAEPHKPHAHA